MAVLMPQHDGIISLQAYSALNQYCAVSIDVNAATAMKVVSAVATGDGIMGIALNAAAAGEEVSVFIGPGLCPAHAGTAGVTQGQLVTTETGEAGLYGEFEAAGDGEPAIGVAMTTATTGEVFTIYMNGVIVASTVANYNAQ